jgi:hypothetical protein
MNYDRIAEKTAFLPDAAKYEVSCASSVSNRKNIHKGIGNASNGICHAYTEGGDSLRNCGLYHDGDKVQEVQIDFKTDLNNQEEGKYCTSNYSNNISAV